MNNLRLSTVALVICLGYSMGGPSVSYLDSNKFEKILVFPEIQGDYTLLLNLVSMAHMTVHQSALSLESLKLLEDPATASASSKPEPRAGFAVVVLGNVGSIESSNNAKCYDVLFNLQRVLGWDFLGVYGPYELDILKAATSKTVTTDLIGLMKRIESRFNLAVRIGPKPVDDTYYGPNLPHTLIVNPDSIWHHGVMWKSLFGHSDGSRVADIWPLLAGDESLACGWALERIMDNFQVGRVVLSHHGRVRCGTRLLSLKPGIRAVLDLSQEPFAIRRISATVEPIWPIAAVPVEAELDADNFDYTLVIPDIHGDYDGFVKALWMAYNSVSSPMTLPAFTEQVNKRTPFPIPNKRILIVQLGDIMDRGPFTLECVDLLLKIEFLFQWKLVALYGNHELMNLHHQADSYIHANDKLQGRRRARKFSISGSLWKRLSSKLVMAAAMRAKGSGLDFANMLFVHGGIDTDWFTEHHKLLQSVPTATASPIAQLNSFAAYSMSQAPDLSRVWGEERSPVWVRALDELPDDQLCDSYLPDLLSQLRVDRIFVGHCPQRSKKVRVRCGGRVILADVAISAWMFGRQNPMVLVMSHKAGGRLASIDATYLKDSGVVISPIWPM